MRRSLLPAALAAAALALACESPPTAPAATPDAAPRGAMVLNDRSEVLLFMVNGCSGEALSGSATQHVVVATTYDAAGGTHLSVKAGLSNLELTGASGVSYVGGYQQLFNYTIRPVQPGVVLTSSVRTRIIGRGRTPNSFMTFLQHRTVNANGEETSYFSDFAIECR